MQKGESTRRRSQQKSCSNPTNRVAAAVFPQQKSTGSVLADPRVFPHLSRSPDLWIISIVRPSQISPMTGFRLAQHLPTYSGGTVRESHPVFYSPAALLPHPQALKRNIYLRKQYTRYCMKCQSKRKVHKSFTVGGDDGNRHKQLRMDGNVQNRHKNTP